MPHALPATRATLDLIAALDVRRRDSRATARRSPTSTRRWPRAYARLAAFEADDARTARHALKVVLTFHLLDCREMPLAALPGYVDGVGIYRDINAAVLKLSASDLAQMLVRELARAGALRRTDAIHRRDVTK